MGNKSGSRKVRIPIAIGTGRRDGCTRATELSCFFICHSFGEGFACRSPSVGFACRSPSEGFACRSPSEGRSLVYPEGSKGSMSRRIMANRERLAVHRSAKLLVSQDYVIAFGNINEQ